MTRTLLLLRHATAGMVPGAPDHERALTPAGRLEAAGAARAAAPYDPALVLCSSARRAQETAQCLGLPTAPTVEDELYLAPAEALLARLWQVPDHVAVVLVVGHNPGLARLATALDDDPRLQRGLRCAALAAFAVGEGSWGDLRTARLVELVEPGR